MSLSLKPSLFERKADAVTCTSPPQSVSSAHEEMDIASIVGQLGGTLKSAIDEIYSVNSETKLLSLNARIEAARAGDHGAAFGIVAEEMQMLSEKTQQIASVMSSRTREKTDDLMRLIDQSVRGTRLSDLALGNIDLIDRNLYERTCDVRWWATDGSLVDAVSNPTEKATEFACERLGVILDAYTVYFDLILCDVDGRVIANGRPNRYQSIGQSQADQQWFKEAMRSRDGDQYAFQCDHASNLVGGEPSLIYGAAVRRGGHRDGEPLGALGILFNWRGLAGPILNDISVSAAEKAETRAYILTPDGRILASRGQEAIGSVLQLPNASKLQEVSKDFYLATIGETLWCIGHAQAPGFETYSTGWHSLVMQPVAND